MRSEFLSRFIPRTPEERAFFQTHEALSPNGTIVTGYVEGKSLSPMIDAQIGVLKSGFAKKTLFEVDTGSSVTVLKPHDGAHLLKGKTFLVRKSFPMVDGTKIETTMVNTEIWFSGKDSSRDTLLAVKVPVYVPDHWSDIYPSILGRDVLGLFARLRITLAEGEVVFEAGDSNKIKAYRKII